MADDGLKGECRCDAIPANVLSGSQLFWQKSMQQNVLQQGGYGGHRPFDFHQSPCDVRMRAKERKSERGEASHPVFHTHSNAACVSLPRIEKPINPFGNVRGNCANKCIFLQQSNYGPPILSSLPCNAALRGRMLLETFVLLITFRENAVQSDLRAGCALQGDTSRL